MLARSVDHRVHGDLLAAQPCPPSCIVCLRPNPDMSTRVLIDGQHHHTLARRRDRSQWGNVDAGLQAAGITDPLLAASYQRCRGVNAEHGKTYFSGHPPAARRQTPVRPRALRPGRYADGSWTPSTLVRHSNARGAGEMVRAVPLRSPPGAQQRPTVAAARRRHRRAMVHPVGPFSRPSSTRCGWTSPSSSTDLRRSSRVCVRVSGGDRPADGPHPGTHSKRAYDHARDLGIAFRLANFIRDVGGISGAGSTCRWRNRSPRSHPR